MILLNIAIINVKESKMIIIGKDNFQVAPVFNEGDYIELFTISHNELLKKDIVDDEKFWEKLTERIAAAVLLTLKEEENKNKFTKGK
jgi:hypothetical protein